MMANKLVFFMASFLILASVIFLMTSQGSSGTNYGGNNQGCAACKYYRRRCLPECIFRPYLMMYLVEDLRRVHRLYGRRTAEKWLQIQSLSPKVREVAMESIIRSRFPVYSRCQVIRNLQYQIALLNAELLRRTRTQLYEITSAISAASRNPPRNRTSNNDYFTRVPVVDASSSHFFPNGGHFVNFAHGNCLPVTMPLGTVQQFLPSSNNLGSTTTTREFLNPTSTAVESPSSELKDFSLNVSVNNNDDFATILPINDRTIEFVSGGLYYDNFRYGECVTVTRPLERSSNARQILPDLNTPCSESNANNNDEDAAFDFDDAAVQASDEQIGAPPRNSDNQIPPTNHI